MRAILAAVLALLALPAAAAAAGDPLRDRQWGLGMIEAEGAHATSTGSGAVVAVVDSGVQADHPDLAGRLLPGRDIVEDDAQPQDGSGHGTHVTGIVGATTGNGTGVASVAPAAALLPVRVLDDDGGGTAGDVAAGIDWAREHGAQVINLSLGADVPLAGAAGGDAVDRAIRRALDAGIVVVAAAGNNGVPVCEQPAADGLLCVGAVDRRGQRSYYSSFGRGLGIVAPGGSGLPGTGEDVLSTFPRSGYAERAGTSQAAPHVAGIAALLVARGVRGSAAAQRILDTATDLGPAGDDAQYGHGLVNAAAAVAGLGGGSPGQPGAPPPGGAPPGGQTAAPPSSARVLVRVRRAQSSRAVRRRGVRVRLRSLVDGRARVRLTVGGRTIARGSGRLYAGRTRTITVRLTTRGRRLVRRDPAFSTRLRARLPGESRERVRRVRLQS